MALNFPGSPTLNDVYTSGGNSWKWNGSSWRVMTAPANVYYVEDTSPLQYDAGSYTTSETGDETTLDSSFTFVGSGTQQIIEISDFSNTSDYTYPFGNGYSRGTSTDIGIISQISFQLDESPWTLIWGQTSMARFGVAQSGAFMFNTNRISVLTKQTLTLGKTYRVYFWYGKLRKNGNGTIGTGLYSNYRTLKVTTLSS